MARWYVNTSSQTKGKEKRPLHSKITNGTHTAIIRLHSSGTVSSFRFPECSLNVFARYKIPIYLMTSSSTNISLAVELSMDTFYLIRHELEHFAKIKLETNISIICIPERLSRNDTGIKGKIIELLRDIPILMISYGSNGSSISVAIRECDYPKALSTLSDNFQDAELKKEYL